MSLLANPKSYNIAFSVASLLLVAVTLVIDRSEEAHNNRQKQIFGMIIFDAAILCTVGLYIIYGSLTQISMSLWILR